MIDHLPPSENVFHHFLLQGGYISLTHPFTRQPSCFITLHHDGKSEAVGIIPFLLYPSRCAVDQCSSGTRSGAKFSLFTAVFE